MNSNNSQRFQINNQLMWVVLLVALLSPVFFGSNRPVFWLMWALFLSIAAAWWFARLAISNAVLRVPLRDVRWLLVAFSLLAFYMLAQMIPLGSLAADVHAVADPSVAIVTNAISLAPGNTLLALVRWLSYGLIFFFTLQICANSARAKSMMNLLFWIIVVHAVIGLLLLYQLGDTIFGIQKWAYEGSATGGFVNRNSFATFLAFGSVLGTIQLTQGLNRTETGGGRKRGGFEVYLERDGLVVIFIGMLLVVVTLVATNSRMGLFAACVGMLTVLALALLKTPGGSRASVILPAIASVPLTILAGILFYGSTLIDRFDSHGTSQDAELRLELYKQVVGMIKTRYLTGFGGDSFEQAYPLFHQLPVSADFTWEKAHSTYLTLWAEYGVLFGSLPLLIFGFLFIRLLIAYFRSTNSDPVLLSALGVILVGAIHSLVDFSLEIQAVSFVFAIITAGGYARVLERNTAKSSASI